MHNGNALDRLGQLRSNTHKLVRDFSDPNPAVPAQPLKKILLAFELRWKLEELVLMPALKDTQGMMLCGTRDAQRELLALRRLASLAREEGSTADRNDVLLSAIDTLASLRTQRVSLALTRGEQAGVVNLSALGLAMDQLLARSNGDATSATARGNLQAVS